MTDTLDTRETYRVAVVVFCETVAVDARDARHIAEAAVHRAVINQALTDTGMVRPFTIAVPSHDKQVTVGAVLDVDTAARGGYLTLAPADAAYREPGGEVAPW